MTADNNLGKLAVSWRVGNSFLPVTEDAMRGRKTALVVHLSPATRAELEGWQRSTTLPAGLARRGRVLLLLAEGKNVKAAADIAGLTVRNARKWAVRYGNQGLAGLYDQPGRGRKPVFSPRSRVARRQNRLRTARSLRPLLVPMGLSGVGSATATRRRRPEHFERDGAADSEPSSFEAVAASSVAVAARAPRRGFCSGRPGD